MKLSEGGFLEKRVFQGRMACTCLILSGCCCLTAFVHVGLKSACFKAGIPLRKIFQQQKVEKMTCWDPGCGTGVGGERGV